MWLSPFTIICSGGCIEVDNPLRIDEDLSDNAPNRLRKTQPLRYIHKELLYHR